VDFIEKLHKELLKPLPGVEIQLEMSAGNRVFYKEFETVNDPKESSILILLFPDSGNWNTIFIKRTTDSSPHSGQMAFPGGMSEPDDKSLYETALREAEEEVGIDSKHVSFVGKLTPLHIPVSNVIVNPFIVTLPARPTLIANKSEVAEIFETPISIFLNKNILSYFIFEYKEKKYKAPSFIIGKYTIWGATAMIWNEFLTIYKKTL